MLNITSRISFLFFVFLWGLNSFFQGLGMTILDVNPRQRIKADISNNSLNRICIENDRIISVFGDKDFFELEADESKGQIFIKPSVLAQDKILAITITSENGVIQDLLLTPKAITASTIILQSKVTSDDFKIINLSRDFNSNGLENFTQGLVEAMASLRSGRLDILDVSKDDLPVRIRQGVEINLVKAYRIGSKVGFHFLVKNLASTPLEIREQDFYVAKDLALSLEKKLIDFAGTTNLYVVSQ